MLETLKKGNWYKSIVYGNGLIDGEILYCLEDDVYSYAISEFDYRLNNCEYKTIQEIFNDNNIPKVIIGISIVEPIDYEEFRSLGL